MDRSAGMYARCYSLFVILGVALFLSAPAAAQSNLDTVKGPNAGEETTLTLTPHELAENLSVRAMGIEGPNYSRWALTVIGAAPDDSIALSMGNETLPIEDIDRPDEGETGPVTFYVSEETFLTIADTEGARLHVGDASMSFPDALRRDMKLIYEQVV